jgi:hypothetical protein
MYVHTLTREPKGDTTQHALLCSVVNHFSLDGPFGNLEDQIRSHRVGERRGEERSARNVREELQVSGL